MSTCDFCHGKPVENAASWTDGKPRPPAACPRCGGVSVEGRDERAWTLWICNECDWTSSTYPPGALCCSTKPHENYLMHAVEVVPKSRLDAALVESEAREREHDECDAEHRVNEARLVRALAVVAEREAVLVEALKDIAGADIATPAPSLKRRARSALAGVVEAEPGGRTDDD